MKMFNQIVLCAGILALGRYADCAITWIIPTNGNGPFGTFRSTATGDLLDAIVEATGASSITYAIVTTTNPNGTFELKTGGHLALATDKTFDYPTMKEYVLKITAAADMSDTVTATATIKVEGAPVFINIPKQMMDNKAAVDTDVATVTAADPDENTVMYTIDSGDTNEDFTIDGTTGVIKVAKELNHETTDKYTLVIKGTDDGTLQLTATTSVFIEVCEGTCATYFAITWIIPTNGNGPIGTFSSTATGDLTDAIVEATGASSITYAIVTTTNPNGIFELKTGGHLALATDKTFDYPTMKEYVLKITAAADMSHTVTATATIKVEGAPVFINIPKQMMDNKAAVDTDVATVTAADPDENTVMYTIDSGDTNEDFTIDGTRGVIKVAKELNHKTMDKYTLVIKGTDDGTLQLTATTSVSIEVCEGTCATDGANTIRSSLALLMIAMTVVFFRL